MLTQKTKYALRALSYLAAYHGKGPVLIADISRKKRIPLKFLENILLGLKKQGILESKKGKGGGYFLAAEPAKIPLAKIIRLVEGPIAMLPCVSLYFYERCKDCNEKDCGMNRVFIQVRDANLKILEKRTLKDLI
jgi:Rrf2 family protein